jgi:phage terminase large subunit GpA-like protein
MNEGYKKILRSDYSLLVSDWAQKHRFLPQSTTSEAGKWNNDRTPYLREIMDCLSPDAMPKQVVFMKGAQIGGTEAGLNWLAYIIHYAPGPTLYVNPSEATAKRNSKMRLNPMIESMSILKERITATSPKESGNTIMQKDFRGGTLIMAGANAPSGLRSVPIRYLFLDEIDEFPKICGNEGDPVDLAIQRTATFGNRKIFMVSTPTIKGDSRIEQAYLDGDQREYFVPCPKCGKMQTLKWSGVDFDREHFIEACYKCCECGELWHEWQKPELLRRGHWVAKYPSRTMASFLLSSLYSPWVSWTAIAKEFLEVKDDIPRLQVWTNTKLAESWEDMAGEQIDPMGLMQRREDWGAMLPPQAVVLTAGVDVQDDRLEIEVVGWGKGEESWSIAYYVLFGDPSTPELWQELDRTLFRRYKHSRAMPDLFVRAACIDSGGHYSDHVIEYACSRGRSHFWAIKGRGGFGNPIWPPSSSLTFKKRKPVWLIGVNDAKSVLFQRLHKESGAGAWHFPMDREKNWFEQLTNETIRKRKYKGVLISEWKPRKDGVRVEALDCRVYAYAALRGAIWNCGFNLDSDAEKLGKIPLRSELPEEEIEERTKPPEPRVRRIISKGVEL